VRIAHRSLLELVSGEAKTVGGFLPRKCLSEAGPKYLIVFRDRPSQAGMPTGNVTEYSTYRQVQKLLRNYFDGEEVYRLSLLFSESCEPIDYLSDL
jgi:hypothetical protein